VLHDRLANFARCSISAQFSSEFANGKIKSPCSDVRDSTPTIISGRWLAQGGAPMPSAQDLIERARMFEERAQRASDPISRQHYREMAAHYRSLAVEHQEMRTTRERELEHGKVSD
jgi:hypothetical protein